MKKICVIFTGGTIGSQIEEVSSSGEASLEDVPKRSYILPNEENNMLLLSLFSKRAVCAGEVEFDTTQPYQILSENLSGKYINLLLGEIKNRLDMGCYHGIIVTHGTDTLQYSAAAAALAFGGSPVPVVFVSSQYPLADERANGLNNFVRAVEYILTAGQGGVCVSYQNDGKPPAIFPGHLLQKHLAFSDEVSVAPFEWEKPWLNFSFPYFDDRSPVLFLEPYPGMMYPPVSESVRAVLFGSYHSGTIATGDKELSDFCLECRQRKIPVYLCGASGGISYKSTEKYEELGIRPIEKTLPVTTYMMLWSIFSKRGSASLE